MALDWQWVVQSERHVIACQLVMYWQVEWLFIGYLMKSLLDWVRLVKDWKLSGSGMVLEWQRIANDRFKILA